MNQRDEEKLQKNRMGSKPDNIIQSDPRNKQN